MKKQIKRILIFFTLAVQANFLVASAERAEKCCECYNAVLATMCITKQQWRTFAQTIVASRLVNARGQNIRQALDQLDGNRIWGALTIAFAIRNESSEKNKEAAQALCVLAENNVLPKPDLIRYLKSGVGYFLTDEEFKS